MLVGGISMLTICPNVASELKLSGGPKFGWLKTLKNWNPTPSTAFSQPGIFVFFMMVKSVLK